MPVTFQQKFRQVGFAACKNRQPVFVNYLLTYFTTGADIDIC